MSKFKIDKEVIYKLRNTANLTKDSAAKLACVSRRTWDSWESGQRNMPESAFRFFMYQVTGNPLQLKRDEPINHSEILVFFDYSCGITPIDSVSPEVFIEIVDSGPDEATVTSLKTLPNGMREPVKTKFVISENKRNYERIREW